MVARRLIGLLLVVASWGLTEVVSHSAVMRGLELRLLDARYQLRDEWGRRPTLDPRIVLVLIDDEARQADPRPPQLWLDRFLEVSAALAQAGAGVVGLDFIILKPTGPLDQLPAKFAGSLMAVYSANVDAEKKGRGGVVLITAVALGERGRSWLSLPDPNLRAVIGDPSFALANLTRDPDGTFRAQQLLPISLTDIDEAGRRPWDFFAPRLAERVLGARFCDVDGPRVQLVRATEEAIEVPTISADDKRLVVNFGRFEGFPTVSWAEVVRLTAHPEALRARFEGKIVLIGLGSRQDNDVVQTPLRGPRVPDLQRFVSGSGTRDMLGVEVHAHTLNTLLTQQWIRTASPLTGQLCMLALCLLTALAVFGLRPGMAVLACTALLLGWFAVAAGLFMRGLWIPAACALPAVVITGAAAGAWRLLVMRKLFGRYVSDVVAEQLLADARHEALGATGRQEVTVLFCDINGFSTACESEPPDRIIAWLNAYFHTMVSAVERHGGWLKQFVGDEIMAVYGVPRLLPDGPRAAMESALDMLDALARARASGAPGFHEVKIGIHTGNVIVGNVGTESRAERAVVGDDVNVGARIMAMAPRLGATLLISEATQVRVANMPGVRFVDRGEHDVKGRAGRVRVYEVERREE